MISLIDKSMKFYSRINRIDLLAINGVPLNIEKRRFMLHLDEIQNIASFFSWKEPYLLLLNSIDTNESRQSVLLMCDIWKHVSFFFNSSLIRRGANSLKRRTYPYDYTIEQIIKHINIWGISFTRNKRTYPNCWLLIIFLFLHLYCIYVNVPVPVPIQNAEYIHS